MLNIWLLNYPRYYVETTTGLQDLYKTTATLLSLCLSLGPPVLQEGCKVRYDLVICRIILNIKKQNIVIIPGFVWRWLVGIPYRWLQQHFCHCVNPFCHLLYWVCLRLVYLCAYYSVYYSNLDTQLTLAQRRNSMWSLFDFQMCAA